jgi:hypothetical protein
VKVETGGNMTIIGRSAKSDMLNLLNVSSDDARVAYLVERAQHGVKVLGINSRHYPILLSLDLDLHLQSLNLVIEGVVLLQPNIGYQGGIMW